MKRTITQNEKLQAFALYTMANQHLAKVREFERAIAKVFGDSEEYNDRVSDALYANPGTADSFDEILNSIGIKVKPIKQKVARFR